MEVPVRQILSLFCSEPSTAPYFCPSETQNPYSDLQGCVNLLTYLLVYHLSSVSPTTTTTKMSVMQGLKHSLAHSRCSKKYAMN